MADKVQHVDFTKSVYCVSGCNLAFDSKELLFEYLKKKWGLRDEDIRSFRFSAGTDFQAGADVQTIRLNEHEAKVMARRVVTQENLDAAVAMGW